MNKLYFKVNAFKKPPNYFNRLREECLGIIPQTPANNFENITLNDIILIQSRFDSLFCLIFIFKA